ncbi:unnamed protein product [Mytilus coruscus]|uniref:Uncharacterized protein n=1 Tax=Mytilus coruscus TaxID=42192 RepID=A0A6J7ZZC9_MYTCO|nr:unnamed protein product [Mytilus coruscus]
MPSDDQISVVSHEIENEISKGGSAISDENNNDSHSQSQPFHDKEFSLFSEGAPGSTDPIKWNNFLHKLTAKLKINCSEETEVDSVKTSYLPSRLNPGNSDKATHLKLPLEGTTIEVFKNVEKEAMSGRLKNRSVRLRDDKAFMVSKKDFTDFCSPPRLDDNIEEELSSTMGNKKKASYIDVAESEDDRVEACSALVACFKSMADMTSRIIANSVINRRKIFLKNVDFSSKATSAKLLNLPLNGAQLFGVACPEECRKSGLLQYNIHGTKTTRRSETNSKFKTTEQVCHTSSLQDRNSPIYSKKSENWGLGSETGFARCIFPYPHSPALQKVSPLQHFGGKVSIPSFAVWSPIGSKDFHKSDGSSRCIITSTNDSHIYVPGQLDVRKQQQSKADKTIAVHSGIVKKSGFDNQCGKILFNSDSNNRISRSSDSLKRGSCFSVSREIQKYKSDDSNIPTFKNSRGTCNVDTTWSNGFIHRFGYMGPTAHETTSALSSSLVETSATQFKSFDSIVSTSSGTSVLVAKPKKFFQGSVIKTGICSGDSSDRCFTVGMGSSYKQLSDSRYLATPVQSETHQLARTQSCAVSSANFSDKSTIQKCASENRQCNCRQLSEQTGRDPIPRALLLGMGLLKWHSFIFQRVEIMDLSYLKS